MTHVSVGCVECESFKSGELEWRLGPGELIMMKYGPRGASRRVGDEEKRYLEVGNGHWYRM